MDAQQLLDHIIKPTHIYMGRNYESKNSNMLSLATAAVEGRCGYFIKQINGPALGVWHMEPKTHNSIWANCAALRNPHFSVQIKKLMIKKSPMDETKNLIISPMYSCAMARLKYAMDPNQLPYYKDIHSVYTYYKRIFNTELGATTYAKFKQAWIYHKLNEIEL